VIFLDIIMPDQDGFGTCRKLAANSETKGIPVVFVTSKNQKADRIWAQMQGAKGFITKPYAPQEILDQLTALA
jgi:twitching motility two-component system response regulator PilH